MSSEALAITGLGCIAAPGQGVAAQLAALRSGSCHLRQRAVPNLPLSASMPLGVVEGPLPAAPCRNSALAIAAGAEALQQAGIPRGPRRRLGLIVGTSTGGMENSEIAYFGQGPEVVSPAYRGQQMHRITRSVAQHLGLGNQQSTHSVACVSAACAIAEASTWLRCGLVDACLVIGCDAHVRITSAGFTSLQLVDPAGCRPLTQERAGMSLGEGAGALVIERAAHARARSATVLASLCGWGIRADGYHPTSPDPEASQLCRAIDDAMADSGLGAADIQWINAHGTGTRDNDASEAIACARCLPGVPVSSIKRIYGHTMGAAAAIEAVACCLAIMHGERYPSAGVELGTPMAGLCIQGSYEPNVTLRGVLSTSLAFGGMDVALVFAEAARCA